MGLLDGISGFLGLKNEFHATAPVNNFSATAPEIQQQNFGGAIQQSQQGFNQSQGAQQSLAQALMAQMNGQGPNPALDQLRQTTDQNTRNAAGLIASQRGLNPALATRLMAENAALANQQATGQAAVMRGNQQLAAQGQLSGLYGQMASQQLQNQGILQSANAQQNQQITQGSLGAQGLNAQAAAQNAELNLGAQQLNAGIAGQNAGTNGKLFGSIVNGAASAMSGGAKGGATSAAHGGVVPGMPVVEGDSPANDFVPTILSPGEIVVPRSVASHPDVLEALAKRPEMKKHAQGFGSVLAARASMKGGK